MQEPNRRVLIAANAKGNDSLREILAHEPFKHWHALHADSFLQVRFYLQHMNCDVVLVDEGLCCLEGWEELDWLATRGNAPVLFLGERAPETFARAYAQGVHMCLPRDWTLTYPPLLAAALERAALQRKATKEHGHVKEKLGQCRRQIDRLVSLIWRMTPAESAQPHWFTQRYMMERLQEELARCSRHGLPLTVALGAVSAVSDDERVLLPDWTSDVLLQSKRRCDVAGQYGMQGFMLILVHTSEAGAQVCCRRLQERLAQAHPAIPGPHGALNTSFGLASVTAETRNPQTLLRRAEEDLERQRTVKLDTFVTEDCLA